MIIASVIGIIVYRLSVFLVFSATLPRHINGTQAIRKYLTPQTATSVTASIISFIIIMVLNIVYEKVAILITDFGMSSLCLRLKLWLQQQAKIAFVFIIRTPVNEYLYHAFQNFPTESYDTI